MKYAVINTAGKQYKVSEGDVLDIDRIDSKDKVVFDKVLLAVDGDKIEIGKPVIPNITVNGKVVKELRGTKIMVSKFKSKVRVRRKMGFRANLSRVLIEKINTVKEIKQKTAPEVKTTTRKKKN